MDTKFNKKKFEKQANEILKEAEKLGLSKNFFFTTTFERYKMQMEILTELEKAIKDNGPTVTREYVKDRPNVVINPAINEYNKTSTACNGTLSSLLKILISVDKETGGEGSKLKELLGQFN
jgi:hypothetical protein